jgi:hypothetical protein
MTTIFLMALLLFVLLAPIMEMNSEKPFLKRLGIGVLFVAVVIAVYSFGSDDTLNNGCNELIQQGNC